MTAAAPRSAAAGRAVSPKSARVGAVVTALRGTRVVFTATAASTTHRGRLRPRVVVVTPAALVLYNADGELKRLVPLHDIAEIRHNSGRPTRTPGRVVGLLCPASGALTAAHPPAAGQRHDILLTFADESRGDAFVGSLRQQVTQLRDARGLPPVRFFAGSAQRIAQDLSLQRPTSWTVYGPMLSALDAASALPQLPPPPPPRERQQPALRTTRAPTVPVGSEAPEVGEEEAGEEEEPTPEPKPEPAAEPAAEPETEAEDFGSQERQETVAVGTVGVGEEDGDEGEAAEELEEDLAAAERYSAATSSAVGTADAVVAGGDYEVSVLNGQQVLAWVPCRVLRDAGSGLVDIQVHDTPLALRHSMCSVRALGVPSTQLRGRPRRRGSGQQASPDELGCGPQCWCTRPSEGTEQAEAPAAASDAPSRRESAGGNSSEEGDNWRAEGEPYCGVPGDDAEVVVLQHNRHFVAWVPCRVAAANGDGTVDVVLHATRRAQRCGFAGGNVAHSVVRDKLRQRAEAGADCGDDHDEVPQGRKLWRAVRENKALFTRPTDVLCDADCWCRLLPPRALPQAVRGVEGDAEWQRRREEVFSGPVGSEAEIAVMSGGVVECWLPCVVVDAEPQGTVLVQVHDTEAARVNGFAGCLQGSVPRTMLRAAGSAQPQSDSGAPVHSEAAADCPAASPAAAPAEDRQPGRGPGGAAGQPGAVAQPLARSVRSPPEPRSPGSPPPALRRAPPHSDHSGLSPPCSPQPASPGCRGPGGPGRSEVRASTAPTSPPPASWSQSPHWQQYATAPAAARPLEPLFSDDSCSDSWCSGAHEPLSPSGLRELRAEVLWLQQEQQRQRRRREALEARLREAGVESAAEAELRTWGVEPLTPDGRAPSLPPWSPWPVSPWSRPDATPPVPAARPLTPASGAQLVPSTRHVAVYDYTPRSADELQVRRGEAVDVLGPAGDPGWGSAMRVADGRTGAVPLNYLAPCS